MKKFFEISIALFMFLLLPGVSLGADSGPYVSGHFGLAFMADNLISEKLRIGWMETEVKGEMKFDPGFEFCLAGGYSWKIFRAEAEFGYQTNGIDSVSVCLGEICVSDVSSSGDVTSFSFLTNGYLDFVNKTSFTPYLTAGIGLTKMEIDGLEVEGLPIGDFDDTVWMYQLGAGIAYAINEKITIDLKYRYFAMLSSEFEGIDTDIEIHNVYFGLRYNF